MPDRNPDNRAQLDYFEFDSQSWPEGEAFEQYRRLYSRGADVIQTGADFAAKVIATRLDGVIIYDRYLRNVGHERPEARIESDGFDHFTLTGVVAGHFEVKARSVFKVVRPGELVLLDMAQEMYNRTHDAHIQTVSINRDFLSRSGVDLNAKHGEILHGPAATFLLDYISLMVRHAVNFDALLARATAHTMLRQIEMVSKGNSPISARDRPDQANSNLAIIAECIERLFDQPDLDIKEIIASSGLSRATIYRALEKFGGVQSYIQFRRLRRMRIDLGLHDISLEELASRNGFRSVSHCSRVFYKAYGMRPGEYRRRVREGERTGSPKDKMDGWLEELLPPSTN